MDQSDPASSVTDFVSTGPDTAAGTYLRRFWQPVYTSHELPSGKALPIRVLGEDFTLYRGETGTPHVTAFRCPHRGAQLSLGTIIQDDLECRYHGWRYSAAGECVAQPAEPKPFCHKVNIATYPTREAMGLIFAYFGAGAPPPLPVWPELEGAQGHRHRMDCNYFQSAENIMDDVHVQFVHRGALNQASPHKGIPKVSVRETSFGLTQYLQHEDTRKLIHFMMPNVCHLVAGFFKDLGANLVFWYVPIDDVTHNHFMAINSPSQLDAAPSDPGARDAWYSDTARDILTGVRSLKDFESNYQYFRLQDTVMCMSQGPIADRGAERLGASDAAVICLRKVWRRELALLASGRPGTSFEVPKSLADFTTMAIHATSNASSQQ